MENEECTPEQLASLRAARAAVERAREDLGGSLPTRRQRWPRRGVELAEFDAKFPEGE